MRSTDDEEEDDKETHEIHEELSDGDTMFEETVPSDLGEDRRG